MITDFLTMDAKDIVPSTHVYYCGGYKYQTREITIFRTPIRPETECVTDLVILRCDGLLIVDRYFAWDGATWCPDVKSIMRGSLAHDAFAYLMRIGLLPRTWLRKINAYLRDCIHEDEGNKLFAGIVETALNKVPANWAEAAGERKVERAP
jgi:hypothetical protein